MPTQIGRFTNLGLAIEDDEAPGTGVAPQIYLARQELTLNINPVVLPDDASYGRREKAIGKIVADNRYEIVISGRLTELLAGYLMLGAMGKLTSSTAKDAPNTVVYDHLFDIEQGSVLPTFSLEVYGQIDKRYTGCVLSTLELNYQPDDTVLYTATFMGTGEEATTGTYAYEAPQFYLTKLTEVKVAADVASLAAADPICPNTMTLTINNNVLEYRGVGCKNHYGQSFEIKGSTELRLEDLTYKTMIDGATTLAMSVTVTGAAELAGVGVTAKPAVAIVMPQITLETWSSRHDNDGIEMQTLGFDSDYDMATPSAAKVTVTSLDTTYTHA